MVCWPQRGDERQEGDLEERNGKGRGTWRLWFEHVGWDFGTMTD